MEFINFEVEAIDNSNSINDLKLNFDENKHFAGNKQIASASGRLYNHSRETHDALNDRSDNNCKLDTRDLQDEMYWEIDWSFVDFDEFEGYEKIVKKIKKSLWAFDISNDPNNFFYNAILFGLLFKLSKNRVKNPDTIVQGLGKEFFKDIKNGNFCSLTFPFVILKNNTM